MKLLTLISAACFIAFLLSSSEYTFGEFDVVAERAESSDAAMAGVR